MAIEVASAGETTPGPGVNVSAAPIKHSLPKTHWAFVPPTLPDVPTFPDSTWPRSPIDRLALHRMLQQDVQPSADASRRQTHNSGARNVQPYFEA